MNGNAVTFDRRGRELRLAARPLLVLPRQRSGGSHNNNETKKPLTQISLQSPTGGVQSTFASGLSEPAGLAFNSAGDLFEADYVSGNIYQFTPDGVRSNFALLYKPGALTFDSVGNLFLVANSGQSITEITPGGVQTNIAWALGISGLAVDSVGNLFFVYETNSIGGTIIKVTPTGAQSTFASGIYGAHGLVIDGAGDLFVTSQFGSQISIFEFAPSGAKTTVASWNGGDPWALAIQPPPIPSLQVVWTNGTIQVNVSMPPPSSSTILQESTDLANWINIYTNTPPFTFTNLPGTILSKCFYRAVVGQ